MIPYENLCLFDISAKDLDRYAVSFLNLSEKPKLIILENPKEYINYKNNGRLKNSNIICSAWYSINKLKKILLKYKIKYLVIDAHRIPDVHIIIAAKQLNIKVLYIQHGMYIPFMKRTFKLFLQQLIKSVRYLWYAFDSNVYYKGLGLSLFKIHMLGYKRNSLDKYDIFPDKAGSFSEYWLEWHIKHYRFSKKSLFIMGNYDFFKFKFSNKYSANYIAYCYQTLLEDGRISEEIMFNFYDSLSKWANKNNYKIIVKVHPLADMKILNIF